MKGFGYIKGKEDLQEMEEVTIQASPEELRSLAEFMQLCAQEMESNENWEHRHYAESGIVSEGFSLVVFRP